VAECVDCDPGVGILSRVSHGAVVPQENLGHQSLVAFFFPVAQRSSPCRIARHHHKCASLERKIIAAQEQDQTNTRTGLWVTDDIAMQPGKVSSSF
jgi:hypothetical protein